VLRRTYALVVAILMPAAMACGQPSATPATATASQTATLSSPCPGPKPLPTVQVTAVISPLPTNPITTTDSSYTLDVPRATELLVVIVDSNASSKDGLVPSFAGPDGQVITRAGLVRDDITGGNPGDLGVSELMQIATPKTGVWILRLRNTGGGQITAKIRATAIFHLHRPPRAAVNAQPASGPAPLTVTFDAAATALDGSTATYCWNFTDGVTALGVKASHTFAKPGIYAVELTVTDDQGRQGYAAAQVTVTS
jgi:PKD repeat protein